MGKKPAKKPTKGAKPGRAKKMKPAKLEIFPMSPTEAQPPSQNEIPVSKFGDPMKMTLAELETNMKQLVRKDTDVEVELSANIAAFWDRREHEKMGVEWTEYFRNSIGIAPFKANALRDNWKALDSIAKLPDAIVGLAWSKIRTLIPAIKAGHITKDNVGDWLEHCTIGGPKSLTVITLETMIKQLMGKASKEAMDTELKTVSFKVPAYEIDSINQFLEIAKNVLKTDNIGNCFLTAALEFSANHAHVVDGQVWRARGLASLKETAERIAPVVALFVPTDPAATKEILGIQPFTQIYQGFGDKTGSGNRELLFCVASSEKEAKQYFGVKEGLRIFPISLAPSFQPKIPFSMAAPSATPAEAPKNQKEALPVETTTEVKKPKKRGKQEEEKPKKTRAKKAKPEQESAPASEAAPTSPEPKQPPVAVKLTVRQEIIKNMSKQEIQLAVKGLISKLSIGQPDFVKKQTDIKANPIPGLTTTQAMLDWLMGMTNERK